MATDSKVLVLGTSIGNITLAIAIRGPSTVFIIMIILVVFLTTTFFPGTIIN